MSPVIENHVHCKKHIDYDYDGSENHLKFFVQKFLYSSATVQHLTFGKFYSFRHSKHEVSTDDLACINSIDKKWTDELKK